MNREIEFEAWHEASKTMFEWKDFSINGRNNCIIHFTEGVFTTTKVDDNYVILRPYTGVRDNTRTKEFPEGRKIFEGDVLSEKWLCVVYVDKNTGAFMVKRGAHVHPSANKPVTLYEYLKKRKKADTAGCDNIVTGNIFQNPNLLKP